MRTGSGLLQSNNLLLTRLVLARMRGNKRPEWIILKERIREDAPIPVRHRYH